MSVPKHDTFMQVTIKDEDDLLRKVTALKKYVGECEEAALARGMQIRRGTWIALPSRDWNDKPTSWTACAVGCIGLRYIEPKDLDKRMRESGIRYNAEHHGGHYNMPAATLPLIRNGATKLVDEMVLWALSDGFERERGASRGRTLYHRYLAAAWEIGADLRRRHHPRKDP